MRDQLSKSSISLHLTPTSSNTTISINYRFQTTSRPSALLDRSSQRSQSHPPGGVNLSTSTTFEPSLRCRSRTSARSRTRLQQTGSHQQQPVSTEAFFFYYLVRNNLAPHPTNQNPSSARGRVCLSTCKALAQRSHQNLTRIPATLHENFLSLLF